MIITSDPPTPAFAKAGAAPGTTGGVELGSRVASKGTRRHGNTSVSYMPQPSTCRLPGLKPSKLSAGLQGNNSYSYMPLPSVFQGVHDKFAWPQTLQTLPQASKATTLTATTCPCHLFFRGFKTAVCPASNPPNASNPPAGLQGNNSYSYYMPLPSVFQGVQDCRLPGLKPPKRFQPSRRPPRQQLLQLLHAPAICFSGGSRLPFARPLTPQTLPTLPQASKATTLTAIYTCPCHLFLTFKTPCHLFFRGFKTAVCPASNPSNASNLPQASKATTLTATCPCHLFFRGFKTAVCPASNPPNASNPPAGLQGNNSYSYMPLPSVLFFKGFKTAVCPASNPPNASAGFQGNNSYSYIHASAICFSGGSSPPSHPPNASAGFQGNNSYSYMPLPSVFPGVQDCRLPGL